jgi:hypothetical protein
MVEWKQTEHSTAVNFVTVLSHFYFSPISNWDEKKTNEP